MKERKSLREYASEAAGGGIECPKCGCRDFKTYGTNPTGTSTFRYKLCRHCGHRVLTVSKENERIVRDVHDDGKTYSVLLPIETPA